MELRQILVGLQRIDGEGSLRVQETRTLLVSDKVFDGHPKRFSDLNTSPCKAQPLPGLIPADFKSPKMQDHYLPKIAAAFVRGRLGIEGTDEDLIAKGREAGLRMHRFKRSTLPRVTKCIGLLKGFYPQTQLDIGTGRGAFLWTMLDEISAVDVTCLDVLEHRVELVNAVSRGGISRIRAEIGDVQDLRFEDDSFDVATALEVVEHLTNPGKAISELCRVSRNYILVSVPSKPDNNPEHINLFSADDLEELLLNNGAQSVQMHHVLNHRIALGKL